MLCWAKATLNGAKGDDGALDSLLRQMRTILSSQIPIENPSLRERSYALGWIRTQLHGIVGMIGDNADYWPFEILPVLAAGSDSRLLICHQGATVGYYPSLPLFPETDFAIVVLTNTAALNDAAD